MIGRLISYNGTIIPQEKALISVDNLAFTYGYGVYENLKVRNKFLYFPLEHLERLTHSAQVISLPLAYSPKQMREFLTAFIALIPDESFNIKMLAVGNNAGTSDLYIFASAPQYLSRKAYTQGVTAITYHGQRTFVSAKTLSMLESYLAYTKAKEQQCYDALLISTIGTITEGTRTNLFFTDGKSIFTPPKDSVLEGVTRAKVMEALQQEGIIVYEKVLPLSELKSYQGYFLTSTSANIVPLSGIDAHSFEIPAIIKQVIKIYEQYLTAYQNY